MTKEEKLWFQQEILDGRPIDQERFQRSLEHLLPDAKVGAVAAWSEFASECVDRKQYAGFIAEPDEAALCRWHDTLLASFVLLTDRFGRDTATQVCNLSLDRCCLHPFEMERAAEELREGAALEKLFQLMENGELEANSPTFPRLQETLDIDALTQSTQPNVTFGQ